jgi:hypothetical protein
MKRLIFTLILSVTFLLSTGTKILAADEVTAKFLNAKSSYSLNQDINISVQLHNSGANTKQLIVVTNVNYVGQSMSGLLEPLSIEIAPQQSKELSVLKGKIDKTYSNVVYTANVTVYENNLVILHDEVNFSINVPEQKLPIDFNVQLCPEINCENPKKVYVEGEKVNFKCNSSISDVICKIQITQPNQTKVNISSNDTFAPLQNGLYTLSITAQKTGYEDTSKIDYFSVNSANIQPQTEDVCRPDNQCKDGETAQNCPQDCTTLPVTDNTSFVGPVFFGIGSLLLVTGVVATFLLLRKYRKKRKHTFNLARNHSVPK